MKQQEAGFSLVELMIAMVAGLIVIGAVVAFTVSTVRAYSENIRSTRLTQDLRAGMNVAQRELRRSGFDARSTTRVLSDTNPSNFIDVTISGECVLYRYDRGLGTADDAPQQSELRGVRRNAQTGTLQVKAGNTAVACNDATGWEDVSDAASVNITQFTPQLRECSFCSRLSSSVGPGGATVYNIATGTTRNLALTLAGALRNDATIARQITDSVRIRAEAVTFNPASATDCPALQVCTMP